MRRAVRRRHGEQIMRKRVEGECRVYDVQSDHARGKVEERVVRKTEVVG